LNSSALNFTPAMRSFVHQVTDAERKGEKI